MPAYHVFLAMLLAVIWGVNFIFIKFALDEFSPLLLCTCRFLCASIPAIFFIKPPSIPFKTVVCYGLTMFALQFSLLFLGIHAGVPPGIASIIMQVQVFFSMIFATLFLSESPSGSDMFGAVVAFVGVGLIAAHTNEHVSINGLILLLMAAATWGFGNLITKKNKTANMLSLVIWGSFTASIPMLILSLILEGPLSLSAHLHHHTWLGIGSLFYIVYGSTLIGYGLWNWLICKYPINTIAPFTLLVPIFALLSSVIFLGEALQPWKVMAAMLVMSGLGINILGKRYRTVVIETS